MGFFLLFFSEILQLSKLKYHWLYTCFIVYGLFDKDIETTPKMPKTQKDIFCITFAKLGLSSFLSNLVAQIPIEIKHEYNTCRMKLLNPFTNNYQFPEFKLTRGIWNKMEIFLKLLQNGIELFREKQATGNRFHYLQIKLTGNRSKQTFPLQSYMNHFNSVSTVTLYQF